MRLVQIGNALLYMAVGNMIAFSVSLSSYYLVNRLKYDFSIADIFISHDNSSYFYWATEVTLYGIIFFVVPSLLLAVLMKFFCDDIRAQKVVRLYFRVFGFFIFFMFVLARRPFSYFAD